MITCRALERIYTRAGRLERGTRLERDRSCSGMGSWRPKEGTGNQGTAGVLAVDLPPSALSIKTLKLHQVP